MTTLIAARTEFAPARYSAGHNDRFSDDGTAVLTDVPGAAPEVGDLVVGGGAGAVAACAACPAVPRHGAESRRHKRVRERRRIGSQREGTVYDHHGAPVAGGRKRDCRSVC